MNELLATWRSSLRVFFPANLKLFLLATLNATIKGLKPFIVYVFPVAVLIKLLQANVCQINDVWCQLFGERSSLLPIILIVGAIAAIRPSVNLKKCNYFRALWLPGLVLFLLWAGFLIAFNWALVGINIPASQVNVVTFGLSLFFALPLMILISYCIFDAPRSLVGILKGLKKGILFTLYNVPFVVFSMILYCAISLLIYIPLLMAALHLDLPAITRYLIPCALFIIFFVLIAWLSIFYTKRIYEQHDLIT